MAIISSSGILLIKDDEGRKSPIAFLTIGGFAPPPQMIT